MVDKNGLIQHKKVIAGQSYRVIETKRGKDKTVWAARDVILNETRGDKKELTRKEWKTLFDKFN